MPPALAPRLFLLQKFPRIIQHILLLLITFSLLTCALIAQVEKEPPTLELGKPIERELVGDAAHSYSIALTTNQFLYVVVEQKGIDVVATLFAPDGTKLVEVDSPNGTSGPEPVSVVTEAAGSYRLEVRSLDAKAEAGRYQVKIEELRAANPQDKNRIAAQQTLAKALQLESEGSAGSRLKAIDKYKEALPLLRAANDRGKEASTLNTIGLIYYSLGENQKALDSYNQALPISREVSDRRVEAVTLNNIGEVYNSLGEKQKALDYYNQALPLSRAVGDRRGEAITLSNIGGLYDSLGEKQKALDYLNQALPLRRAVGDRSGEAVTLNNIGSVYDSLGEKQRALDFYNQALQVIRAIGDRYGEAVMLSNIGHAYDSLGEKQKALDYYKQSLPLRRAVGDRGGEAVTLNNIGWVYYSLGAKQEALDYLNQALPLIRAVGDRAGEAAMLHNIGGLYDSIGEKQKALDLFNQALLIRRAVGDRAGEAATLHNIGSLYDTLGEKQKALDYFNQALPLRRAAGDRGGEASTLNNIGRVYDSLGETQKALDYFNQALPLSRAVGNRSGEAYTLNNISAVYASLGEQQKALDYYNQALSLFRAVGERSGEALTLNNIGYVYESQGEKQKALDYYNQALPLRRAVGDRNGEAMTLANVAKVERDRGDLREARTRIEEALAIVEALRTRIASQELRSSYFATVQKFYDLYIDILMRLHRQHLNAGNDGAALQASERGRARSLLETLAETGEDIRQGVDPTLVARERSFQIELDAKAQTQMRLLNGKHSETQAEAIAKEIDGLTTEYQQIEAEIRQKSPNYAALTQPQPLTLKEIQTQVLDKDTLLLEYSLGDEHSYLWAVTTDSITSFELPKRVEIETLALHVYALLSDPNRWNTRRTTGEKLSTTRESDASLDDARRLSQMLLAPIAAQLSNKRLVVIADGALQYIPFGALPSPQLRSAPGQARAYHPLVIEHEIVSLPSASTLSVLRLQVKDRKPAAKAVAVLADPVFEKNDERVGHAINGTPSTANDKSTVSEVRELPLGFERSADESGLRGVELKIPRLPGTRAEAKQILSLVPPAQRKEAFDFAANRQAAMNDELSQYRYVHFATHGFLNSVHPELSGLVFSMVDETGKPQDGFLRAHQIFNLRLPAELVVLSACQSGLGKEVRGEGLVGLTRGFMYAGSPRVVVSLWSVSDSATAELMTNFYREMLKNNMRPAAALRTAQISLMKEKRWASPFYWAPFILQGEWR